jgi:glycosyltransferase involved in cell wall biosynthesis
MNTIENADFRSERSFTVSVIIRNRNEATHLRRVLKALSLQDVEPEVILVDNESEDDSVAVGMEFGAKVVTLKKSLFSYGRALNIGLAHATGEICVLLSAHSLPVGANFLRDCALPFADDRIAAVRCLHLEKGFDIERWISPELLSYPISVETIISKGPLANCCAIRRTVWEQIPFDEQIIAAEEKLWALEVLKQGHLIYSPCSASYYYMKRLPLIKAIIKNDREIAAVYSRVGFRAGFAKQRPIECLSELFNTVIYGAPSAAISELVAATLKSYLSFSLSLRAKRPLSSGFQQGRAELKPMLPPKSSTQPRETSLIHNED